mmetsp:Transcript_6916/g.11155  ORF Transcript_6916/g.11155 Transcript_6916/m.11155 type:complete len:88 (-) Transcript_6916:102-365(-)
MRISLILLLISLVSDALGFRFDQRHHLKAERGHTKASAAARNSKNQNVDGRESKAAEKGARKMVESLSGHPHHGAAPNQHGGWNGDG